MVLPSVFLVHSATINHKAQNFTLAYDGGTAVFTATKTLTGATSHATAIIVSTGAQASGTLTLHTVSGVFQNNEVLIDNNSSPGAAVSAGTTAEALDAYGALTYTDVSTAVSCRFVRPVQRFTGSPVVIQTSPRVLLPAGTAVSVNDTIASTDTGFAETFQINTVYQVYEAAQATVSHISCDIAAVV
jgi:hypothetical protein